jgi:glucose/arabinose dehydrogenase
MKFTCASVLLACAVTADAATLPGFRAERVAPVTPFLTSLAVDSRGILYYTAKGGTLFRLEEGQSLPLAQVTTVGEGNAGLLGMALLDDQTAVVHYTTPNQTHDVIARIDLRTGAETIIHSFACDIEVPERGSSTEHHGGNPIVAADGSIFVGIGEYGERGIAALENWNGGKIFRIHPDGSVSQFARGMRNPFDLVWDAARQRVIVADNGPDGGDELNIIQHGANCGWPFTYGREPAGEGVTIPDYVFASTVAPTGNLLLSGRTPYLRSGLLLGAYVTKAIYYFPHLNAQPIPDPIALIEEETASVIDVAEGPAGELYFATGFEIYRLVPPSPGDCNGDGNVDGADVAFLQMELGEGAQEAAIEAQNGAIRASWGCDVNADGVISTADLDLLRGMVKTRRRAVSSH